MQVEKIYRNHKTGAEKIVVVEKPDDIFLRGCAHVQTFEADNGDMVEEVISPNIVTNYVKNQLGRVIFNGLMWGQTNIGGGGLIGATMPIAGIAVIQSVPGEANTIVLSSNISSSVNGLAYAAYNPFQRMFLSTYSTAEDATEIWVPNTVVPIAGSQRYTGYNLAADSPNYSLCSISSDGNTFTFVWDYATTDWNGSFQSIHFAYNNVANSAQFARTLLAAPVTKSSSQTLRITYTFTFTP